MGSVSFAPLLPNRSPATHRRASNTLGLANSFSTPHLNRWRSRFIAWLIVVRQSLRSRGLPSGASSTSICRNALNRSGPKSLPVHALLPSSAANGLVLSVSLTRLDSDGSLVHTSRFCVWLLPSLF